MASMSDRARTRNYPHELLRVSGTQLDPMAIEVFVAEEATLREMVDMKRAVAPTS